MPLRYVGFVLRTGYVTILQREYYRYQEGSRKYREATLYSALVILLRGADAAVQDFFFKMKYHLHVVRTLDQIRSGVGVIVRGL